jgi:hypothetical protein
MAVTASGIRAAVAMSRLRTVTNSKRAIQINRKVAQPSDPTRESRDKTTPSFLSDRTGAPTTKTIAQQDKELEEKLAGRAGDGGSAGIEYENGKAVSMKRSVKNNMFRYI